MQSAGWTHSGRILLNASRVYYLPDEPSLPPLRWMPEKQTFEFLRSTNNEDVELRASITELAQACSQLYHLQSVQQQSIAASLSCYLPCEALYGVLPLGAANSALIYVTEKEYVCSLRIAGAQHDIYAVRGLQWLNLPAVTSAATSQHRGRHHRRESHARPRRSRRASSSSSSPGGAAGQTEEGDGDSDETSGRDGDERRGRRSSQRQRGGNDTAAAAAEEEEGDEGVDSSATDDDVQDARGRRNSSHRGRHHDSGPRDLDDDEEDEDAPEEVGRLPGKTVNDYLAVLHRFCEAVNTQDGGQHAHARRAEKGNQLQEEEEREDGDVSELPGIMGPAGSFSYLYYSPTLDLSANPVHLLGLLSNTAYPSLAVQGDVSDTSLSSTTHHDLAASGTQVELGEMSKTSRPGSNAAFGQHAWEDLRAAATTRQLYQWNGPLLTEGLAVPTMPALRAEWVHAHHGVAPETAGENAPRSPLPLLLLPWRGVCVEEVQRDSRTYPHGRPNTVHGSAPSSLSNPTSTAPSSVLLYIPSFIRGLVAHSPASAQADMTLITRTCCRWAGTRYNRRGLEPGQSGVVANMSLTSLWVTAHVGAGEATGKGVKIAAEASTSTRLDNTSSTPFAVYTVMRGSVPRRWEQPANLSLKPTIKISQLGNAAEEVGRHVRLLKQCLPSLHALYCLDTMSSSKLEEPLGEAFAAAVRRYNEGTPKTTTPINTTLAEEKGGGGAALLPDGHNSTHAADATADRDPTVTLVKFNVKKEMKRHPYETMMRRCLAEMDSAGHGEGSWLDFTKGHVRALREDESAVGVSGNGGGNGTSSLSVSLSNTIPAGRGGDNTSTSGAASQQQQEQQQQQLDASPRLVFDHEQASLVRVNCLDCLDRTNLVQSILLCAVLPRMMAYVSGDTLSPRDAARVSSSQLVQWCMHDPKYARAAHRLRVLMAAQGTALSQLYAGTEPHFIPYMLSGRYHWTHKALEGVLAQRRWYQQNFFDGVKQDGISLITRQHNPQVFNADIESPFSRDLSGMNRQVMYGLLLGVFPFLYSVMVCFSEPHFGSSVFQLHFGICLCWVVYLSVLYNKLMRYRVTYTNRPLLLYTRQAEWC